MKRTLVLVEGFLDAEVVGKVLRIDGFSHVRHKTQLDPFWLQLIPSQFPVSDDMHERVNVPMFYQRPNSQVAIKACGSLSKIEPNYRSLKNVVFPNFAGIDNVFVFADADKNTEAKVRSQLVASLAFPSPGKAVARSGSTQYGMYIIPDNSSQGTIESVLLECGSSVYADLLDKAKTFVESVDRSKLSASDLDEISKPFGSEKAVLGAATSILKPGKSSAPSVSDNQWVDGVTGKPGHLNSIQLYILPHL